MTKSLDEIGYFASADDAEECYRFAEEFFHQPFQRTHHAEV